MQAEATFGDIASVTSTTVDMSENASADSDKIKAILRRSKPNQERRRTIIDAAVSEIARRGFGATSIDTIARAAGVTKPTVYSYFKDKNELLTESVRDKASRLNLMAYLRLRAIFDGAAEDFPDHPRLGINPHPVLVNAGLAIMNFYQDPDVAAFRRLVVYEAPNLADQMREAASVLGHPAISELALAFRRFAAARRLYIPQQSKDRNPKSHPYRQAAHQFISLVAGDAVALSLIGIRYGDEEAQEIVERGVSTFLQAYTPEGIFIAGQKIISEIEPV